jgi:hypothetical protein
MMDPASAQEMHAMTRMRILCSMQLVPIAYALEYQRLKDARMKQHAISCPIRMSTMDRVFMLVRELFRDLKTPLLEPQRRIHTMD